MSAPVREVTIPAGGSGIVGNLVLPTDCRGIVLFAHGSGSSRHSPRNNFVAGVLNQAGIATLLLDLLTFDEDLEYANRFDINLLTRRLIAATDWVRTKSAPRNLAIGYFGASTGAAAALNAAAMEGEGIAAVVSRGGRPDLAGMDSFSAITAPTLLLVGGLDTPVIDLNRRVFALLNCDKRLDIVPGATHLFEEPGTLEQVAQSASEWFARYFHCA